MGKVRTKRWGVSGRAEKAREVRADLVRQVRGSDSKSPKQDAFLLYSPGCPSVLVGTGEAAWGQSTHCASSG